MQCSLVYGVLRSALPACNWLLKPHICCAWESRVIALQRANRKTGAWLRGISAGKQSNMIQMIHGTCLAGDARGAQGAGLKNASLEWLCCSRCVPGPACAVPDGTPHSLTTHSAVVDHVALFATVSRPCCRMRSRRQRVCDATKRAMAGASAAPPGADSRSWSDPA